MWSSAPARPGRRPPSRRPRPANAWPIIERDRQVGGNCVHTGTIPSKSLREHALRQRVRRVDLHSEPIQSLLDGVGETIAAHDAYMAAQLERNHIALLRGRASFLDAKTLAMRRIDGSQTRVCAPVIIIATGSRPRTPAHLAVDHEHVLDSDSILSLAYLPRIAAGAGWWRHRQRIRRHVRRAGLQGDPGRPVRPAAGLPRSRAHVRSTSTSSQRRW